MDSSDCDRGRGCGRRSEPRRGARARGFRRPPRPRRDRCLEPRAEALSRARRWHCAPLPGGGRQGRQAMVRPHRHRRQIQGSGLVAAPRGEARPALAARRDRAHDPKNPMGARVLSLPGEYAIHGTSASMRSSIGTAASYGCIRMLNEDIVDLYERVRVGTRHRSPLTSSRRKPAGSGAISGCGRARASFFAITGRLHLLRRLDHMERRRRAGRACGRPCPSSSPS